jgi:hypothetical protein
MLMWAYTLSCGRGSSACNRVKTPHVCSFRVLVGAMVICRWGQARGKWPLQWLISVALLLLRYVHDHLGFAVAAHNSKAVRACQSGSIHGCGVCCRICYDLDQSDCHAAAALCCVVQQGLGGGAWCRWVAGFEWVCYGVDQSDCHVAATMLSDAAKPREGAWCRGLAVSGWLGRQQLHGVSISFVEAS